MAFIKDRIEWITAQMPRAFNTLVDPNLEVRRLPLAEEPGGLKPTGKPRQPLGSYPPDQALL